MKGKLIVPCLGLSLITSALMIAGCGGPKSYEKQHYILDTQRASSAAPANKSSIVEVRRFAVASAFSSKSLIYRTGEFKYESDFYNEFLVPPKRDDYRKDPQLTLGDGAFCQSADLRQQC